MGVRFWVDSRHYFQARYAVNGAVLGALQGAGIRMLAAGAMAGAAGSLSADEDDGNGDGDAKMT